MTKFGMLTRRCLALLAFGLALIAALLHGYGVARGSVYAHTPDLVRVAYCASDGLRYTTSGTEGPVRAPSGGDLPHCPLCLLSQAPAIAPPSATPPLPVSLHPTVMLFPRATAPAPRYRVSIHHGYPRPPPA